MKLNYIKTGNEGQRSAGVVLKWPDGRMMAKRSMQQTSLSSYTYDLNIVLSRVVLTWPSTDHYASVTRIIEVVKIVMAGGRNQPITCRMPSVGSSSWVSPYDFSCLLSPPNTNPFRLLPNIPRAPARSCWAPSSAHHPAWHTRPDQAIRTWQRHIATIIIMSLSSTISSVLYYWWDGSNCPMLPPHVM